MSSHRHLVSRSFIGIFGSVALLLATANRCHAADGVTDCSAAYHAATSLEQAGRLRDAALLFQGCAADSCGNPARSVCQGKLVRLQLDVPSVVPLVKDANGAPIVAAEVAMDGLVLSSRLDGRAFPIDPGLHEFTFSVDGRSVGSQRVLIAQGERNRALGLTLPSRALEPAEAPAPVVATSNEAPTVSTAEMPADHDETEPVIASDEQLAEISAAPNPQPREVAPPLAMTSDEGSHASVSVAPYLFGGGALLSAGAYVALSSWARGDNQKLSRCSPNCSPNSISHIRSLYLAADISLGVAAAAAVTSAVWFLVSGTSSHADRARGSNRGLALAVQPERAGALATLRGTL
jgi:hypothetical protein